MSQIEGVGKKLAYLKTQKGWDEIAATHRSLNFRQRQVLILIDGKRTREALASMLHHPDLDASLDLLLQQGYIGDTDAATSFFAAGATPEQSPNASLSSPSQPVSGQPISSQLDPSEIATPSQPATLPDSIASVMQAPSEQLEIDQVRQLMVESIDTYLGILGKPLKQKVQAAAPGHQLMQVISQWHLAMCESKRGREVQAELMSKIKALLGE